MLRKAIKIDLGKDCDEKGICINLYQVMLAAAPQPEQVDVDLLKEVHLINDNYKRIRSERQFAIEYDLFSAGWKAAIDLAMSQGEQG